MGLPGTSRTCLSSGQNSGTRNARSGSRGGKGRGKHLDYHGNRNYRSFGVLCTHRTLGLCRRDCKPGSARRILDCAQRRPAIALFSR